MGKATDVGLRIAGDLRDFAEGRLAASELDRGMVLEVGLRMRQDVLAKALAATAGASWRRPGLAGARMPRHLGTFARRNAGDFRRSPCSAPCGVLLVDELDSFADLGVFLDARHRDYSRQVVNAFLEQLDGSTSRAGVFVVGCTNDAAGLDPAIPGQGSSGTGHPGAAAGRPGLAGDLPAVSGRRIAGGGSTPLVAVAHISAGQRAPMSSDGAASRGAQRGERGAHWRCRISSMKSESRPCCTSARRWRTVHEAGHAGCLLLRA